MLRLLGVLLTVLFAIATAIVVWPQFFRLEQTFPFAQIVAVRGAVVVVFAGIAVLALLLMLAKPLRGFAASILVISLVGGIATGAIAFTRGIGTGELPEKTDGSIRVMVWNTGGEAVSAETIARVAAEQQADIVTLPETAEGVGERIAVALREQGNPMWVHNVQYNDEVQNGPQAWQTTVLISPRLGNYSVIDSSSDGSSNTGAVPSAVIMPVDGKGPTVVAVHAIAPRLDVMSRWREDLSWVADQCPSGNVILAGDFNATLDHMASLGTHGGDIGACNDAASSTGTGTAGTWPSSIPAQLGAPIDRVMASADWQATGSLIVDDAGGSDHRALIAQLEPTG